MELNCLWNSKDSVEAFAQSKFSKQTGKGVCVCVGRGGGEWVVVVVKVSWIDATSKLVCDNISKCCSKYILAW